MKKKYYIHYSEFYPAMKPRISFEMALYTGRIIKINSDQYKIETYKQDIKENPCNRISGQFDDRDKEIIIDTRKFGRIYLKNHSYKISKKMNCP